jgi:predicted transposase/invertase (TIGR01784 family)
MNDTLFKMTFVKYPHLLKRLVAQLLAIPADGIERFEIRNPEMPPEEIGKKLCRLDINMTVGDRLVDLELQVEDDGGYPERTVFYWAREFSAALSEGDDYFDLPRVVVISIVNFNMFACAELHSEFRLLEVSRHTPLTDKIALHYFELPKLPELGAKPAVSDELYLWLTLFSAKTEEVLQKIADLEVPIMKEAIEAYRHVSATEEFQRLERMRSDALRREASAIGHARREESAKWQKVIARKEAETAAVLAKKEVETAAALAEKEALIAELRARLGEDG